MIPCPLTTTTASTATTRVNQPSVPNSSMSSFTIFARPFWISNRPIKSVSSPKGSKHIDLKTRFGSSVARAYHQLAKQSSGRQSHVDDTEGRRVKTVHDLLTQMREELFEINTWFHAEIVPSSEPVEDGRANGASQHPGQSVNDSHRYRVTECVDQAIALRLDQIIAGRSWGIGFVFNDQSVTDKIVALMTANALRRFSRDLQDLATVLPRVLRGDPDRFPQLVPPRSGRAFEQLITDIVNEDDRHAQLSGLCEDYLQKTDIRVNYSDLDRKRGARVQVTIASSGKHHRKKVEGIRHPEEFVILSPWSLASAVPQIGASGHDGPKPLFSTELIGRFWKCFPNPPSDIDDLSRQLKKMLCGPLNSPIRDPRGPLSEVPRTDSRVHSNLGSRRGTAQYPCTPSARSD